MPEAVENQGYWLMLSREATKLYSTGVWLVEPRLGLGQEIDTLDSLTALNTSRGDFFLLRVPLFPARLDAKLDFYLVYTFCWELSDWDGLRAEALVRT